MVVKNGDIPGDLPSWQLKIGTIRTEIMYVQYMYPSVLFQGRLGHQADGKGCLFLAQDSLA